MTGTTSALVVKTQGLAQALRAGAPPSEGNESLPLHPPAHRTARHHRLQPRRYGPARRLVNQPHHPLNKLAAQGEEILGTMLLIWGIGAGISLTRPEK